MLIQLVEPEVPIHEIAVGIDLGTTHAVVAVSENQNIRVLNLVNDVKEAGLVPSIVNDFRSFKRFMSTPLHTLTNTSGDIETPFHLSSLLLTFLKTETERVLGRSVDQAVITVPAYFDDTARQATRDAARLAGWTVLRLINEPTAAALAYGLDQDKEGLYAVYDWGGGTFDCSLLRLEKGLFQVMATGGDLFLGGDDIDQEILDFLGSSRDLFHARKIKEALTYEENIDGLSRQDLVRIATPWIEKTISICEEVLRSANYRINDLEGMILVGGGSRLWGVKERLYEFLGKPPLCNLDPDRIVAEGAALHAEALIRSSGHLLLDVTPLSLGLETLGGIVEPLIPRHTPIPARAQQEFTTHADYQTGMSIHVVQGERTLVDDCRSLARFDLKDIPALPAGRARVRILFSLDADGILHVSAEETTTGIRQSIEVRPSYGLSEADIEDRLRESLVQGAQDKKERLWIQTSLEADNLMHSMMRALEQDGDLVTDDEKKEFLRLFDVIKQHKIDKDCDFIKQQLGELSNVSRPFIERRLIRALRSV